MWDTMPNPLRQTAIVTAPLLTDHLIDRLVRIDADAMVARMSALRADDEICPHVPSFWCAWTQSSASSVLKKMVKVSGCSGSATSVTVQSRG